jgi:ABC-type transport system substrate-binding protein
MGRRIGTLLAVALLACALLAGCDLGGSSRDPVPDEQQVLRLYAGEVLNLDPATAQNPPSEAQPLPLLYGSLVTLDANLRPVPYDADRVDVSADGLSYTFHLRSNLRFGDGASLTADDVAYSINRAISPCTMDINVNLYVAALKDALTFAGEGCEDGRPTGAEAGQPPAIATLIGMPSSCPIPRHCNSS